MTARIKTETLAFYINGNPALSGELSLDQAYERVTSSGQSPNPRWEFTDANGHYHAHSDDKDDRYPTLARHVEHAECDGSCGGMCNGEGYHVTRYTCRACNAEIKPGVIPGPYSVSIPGLRSWEAWVDGLVRSFDEDLSVRITVSGETWFGFARCVEAESRGYGDESENRSHLVGLGPLGRRKA